LTEELRQCFSHPDRLKWPHTLALDS
jgi:hypothetical protein